MFRSQRQCLRHDAVQHHGAHAVREQPQVNLGSACAVGAAKQVDLLIAQGGPRCVNVMHGDGRGVKRGSPSSESRHSCVVRPVRPSPGPALRPVRFAGISGIGLPGAALVDQQDVPVSFTFLRAPAMMGQLSVADWPGPPAKKTSGSGSATRPLAGMRATRTWIFRPSGSSGFSATSIQPHSPTVDRGVPGTTSSQVSSSRPVSPSPAGQKRSLKPATGRP